MASTVVFHCPECEAQLMAKEEIAGKRVACPQCSQPIDIPAMNESVESNSSQR